MKGLKRIRLLGGIVISCCPFFFTACDMMDSNSSSSVDYAKYNQMDGPDGGKQGYRSEAKATKAMAPTNHSMVEPSVTTVVAPAKSEAKTVPLDAPVVPMAPEVH